MRPKAARRIGPKSAIIPHFRLRPANRRTILPGLEGGCLLRRVLVIAMLTCLGACAALDSRLGWLTPPKAAPPLGAPTPAEGLWAILDPGCPKPDAPNIRAWPTCASPFWIAGGKALVIRAEPRGRRALIEASYAADYRLAAGDPVIAQVGTAKDGYVFLALTDLARDDRGRLVGATGAAVACAGADGGALALKPNANGCGEADPQLVRKAAGLALRDRAGLSRVAWIAPGAPETP